MLSKVIFIVGIISLGIVFISLVTFHYGFSLKFVGVPFGLFVLGAIIYLWETKVS